MLLLKCFSGALRNPAACRERLFMDLEGCTLFSADDAPLYKTFFEQSKTEISDSCLNSRVAWNSGFAYHKCVIDDTLCLITDGGMFTTPHMTWPVGKMDKPTLQRIIDYIWPVFEARQWPLRMMYIDEVNLPLVEALEGYKHNISYNRDYSDYLYDADELRDLSGKSNHGKRNHINRFMRTYPDFQYKSISQEHRDEALALVKAWCDEKDLDCMDLTNSDYRAIRQLFIDFEKLELHGGTIWVNQQLVAFSLGSIPRPDTAVIHFEKADAKYRGLYAMINKWSMDHAFPDVKFVNREEDMGIRGLRKAKKSYNPLRMIHKYEVTLSK